MIGICIERKFNDTPYWRISLKRFLIVGFLAFIGSLSICAVERPGEITSDERWTVADSPFLITADLTIPAGVSVTVEPGVEIQLHPSVNVFVRGSLRVVGTAADPVRFIPNGDSRWGAVCFEENGTGLLEHSEFHRGSVGPGDSTGVVSANQCAAPVNIESCTFTDWSVNATQAFYASQMSIHRCWFGAGPTEAVHGWGSPVLVEYCVFEPRSGYRDAIDIDGIKLPNPRAVIQKNIFYGGEDDAIDMDDCDAYVDGNLIMNFRGGEHDPIGISGDRDSKPIIVNNVVINCESGVAFKNGADITVVNNTIVDCDRGIWMHQNPAHALLINTIVWGRDDQVSIQLEPGSTVDVSHCIIRGDTLYAGEGNLNLEPLFADPGAFDFHLLPGSPAIDAGYGHELVPDWDFDGVGRIDNPSVENTGKGTPTYVDIGAFEFIPESAIENWRLH